MRGLKFLWLLLLFVGVSAPTAAQEDWQIWLYDGLQIHILTDNGIRSTVRVPAGAQGLQYAAGVSNEYYRQVRVSPDHRYMVYANTQMPGDGTPPTASLQIADLVKQTCCYTLPTPFEGHADIILVGPFSPDGRQVAALITRVYSNVGFENIGIESVLLTLDLETHDITARLSLIETLGDIGVFFREWDEAGIKITPTCLACEGSISGFYSNWNPATGEITPNAGYFDVGGDTLLATNELIRPAQNTDYPMSTEPSRDGWNNVIEYFATGTPHDAVVIYHDPNNLKLGKVNWVIGGQAYLMFPQVIFRDGTVQTLSLEPYDLEFVVGTPDGWIMQGRESYCLTYYSYRTDGTITPTDMGCLPRAVTVVDAPLLDGGGAITPIIR